MDVERLRYPIGRFEPIPNPTSAQRGEWILDITELPEQVRIAVQSLTPEQLTTPYRPGGWTVQQVVHHLADNDMNAFIRFKRALTEECPQAGSYREDLWAELGDYYVPVEISLVLMKAVHDRFAALLRGMRENEFERTFISPAHGLMTLNVAVQRYAWHGRHHLAQLLLLRERMGWNT